MVQPTQPYDSLKYGTHFEEIYLWYKYVINMYLTTPRENIVKNLSGGVHDMRIVSQHASIKK